ncbi:TlpA family protein disulfide reductase [Sanguibacteroides justesenii]|uniref:Thioredoxin domain-containing protein n=1 Tax=Sanguibacteroides justesenii TaxID=1547597 RepID=A0AB34R3A8_9PORP|nr:TlpA disulfide reductase family protein [Sanguibacteroides justesenii]KIO45442.1 hypothetical protein IE90_08495 [Sanguibacteroides justesenii]
MMKFGLIVVLLVLFISCTRNQRVVVDFNLVGTNEHRFVLSVDTTEYRVDVDDKGHGRIVLNELGYGVLKYGKDRIPLFFESGKSLSIFIYGNKVRQNVRFEGDGAAKNIYLNSRRFQEGSLDYALGERDFLNQLKDHITSQCEHLDSMSFDPEFTKTERERIKFTTYTVLENYPLYHAWSTGNKDFLPDTAYMDCIRALIREDEKLMTLKEYKEGMASLVSLISTYRIQEFDAYKRVMAQFDYVKKNLKNKVLIEYLIDRFAYNYLVGSGIDEHTEEIVAVYDYYVKDSALRKHFYDFYNRCARIVKGCPALDFTYTDQNGNIVRSLDFRGKYLLLNVWATWGAPCRIESVAWDKLVEKFKGKKIAFVSISCDKDRGTWERFLKEKHTCDIELHMGENRELMDFYLIRGIPRFILIDPEGNIVDSDFLRPTNPETETYLKQLF